MKRLFVEVPDGLLERSNISAKLKGMSIDTYVGMCLLKELNSNKEEQLTF